METANKNASFKARKLLESLCSAAGNKIFSGQHTQTLAMEEIARIKKATGHEPKLRGFELLAYSPNINYSDADEECLKEVREAAGTAKTALEWDKASDGIVTFTFHWFSPTGGRDKSFFSKNTEFDPQKVLQEGTDERKAFFSDMDCIAEILKEFRDADIPILWRPFHECGGDWFWWGRRGPEVARELYSLMFERYTKFHKLDNLLWVWNCDSAYPGDDKVDVISVDAYLENEAGDYREEYEVLTKGLGANKVTALAEVGRLPNVDLLAKTKIPWAYFMLWSKDFCIGEKYNSTNLLRRVYQSPYVETI